MVSGEPKRKSWIGSLESNLVVQSRLGTSLQFDWLELLLGLDRRDRAGAFVDEKSPAKFAGPIAIGPHNKPSKGA
jgi:hypothetical protein